MPTTCVANNCSVRFKKGQNIKFHSFPKAEKLREQWISALKRIDFVPTPSSKVCSNHFQENDYEINVFGTRILKKNVIPSKFCFKNSFCKRIRLEEDGSPDSNVMGDIPPASPIATIPNPSLTSATCSGEFNVGEEVSVPSTSQKILIIQVLDNSKTNVQRQESTPHKSVEKQDSVPSTTQSTQIIQVLHNSKTNEQRQESTPHKSIEKQDSVPSTTQSTQTIQVLHNPKTNVQRQESTPYKSVEEQDSVPSTSQTTQIIQVLHNSKTNIQRHELTSLKSVEDHRDSFPSTSQKTQIIQVLHNSETNMQRHEPTPLESGTNIHKRKRSIPVYVGDFKESDLECPMKRQRYWDISQSVIKQYRKTYKYLQCKISRSNKKITHLKGLIYDLKRRHQYSSEHQ